MEHEYPNWTKKYVTQLYFLHFWRDCYTDQNLNFRSPRKASTSVAPTPTGYSTTTTLEFVTSTSHATTESLTSCHAFPGNYIIQIEYPFYTHFSRSNQGDCKQSNIRGPDKEASYQNENCRISAILGLKKKFL